VGTFLQALKTSTFQKLISVLQFNPEASVNRHKSSTSYAAFLLTALFSLIIFNSTFAQTNLTSSVRGTVTDPQGGAVAGATVTLTGTETNAARTQSTNEDGNFVLGAALLERRFRVI